MMSKSINLITKVWNSVIMYQVSTFSLILISLFFYTNIYSQSELGWAISFGGADGDFSSSIVVDNDYNIYSCGYFSSIMDVDPGLGIYSLNSAGLYDIFIQKLDVNGDFMWAKGIGSVGQDQALTMVYDGSANLYIAGTFEDTVDFDPGPDTCFLISNGTYDNFIMKLDTAGNYIWAKSFGGSLNEAALELRIDLAGDIYLIGDFQDTVDFDPGNGVDLKISLGHSDCFILKLNTDGEYIWVKTFGGIDVDQGLSISIDSLNNIIAGGYFGDTVDFDPGPGIYNQTSNGMCDIYILKLDANGNFMWVKSCGGTSNEHCQSIRIDQNQDIILSGYFMGSCDFDPGPGIYNKTSNGLSDIYILKLDAMGNFIWNKTIGSAFMDIGGYLTVNNNGSIYLIGTNQNDTDFDPGPDSVIVYSQGGFDIFILKLDLNGNFVWVKNMGGAFYDGGSELCVDKLGAIYSVGSFGLTVDFDPGSLYYPLVSEGNKDAFIQKINSSSNINVQYISACDFFLSPNGNTTWLNSGTYIDTLTNSSGNDSIIIFHLTINSSSVSTIDTTVCNYYLSTGGNNTWNSSGSYIDTINNSIGCDSIISINLTVTHIDTTTYIQDSILYSNAIGLTYQWLNCDNNFEEVPGETSQFFIPFFHGSIPE